MNIDASNIDIMAIDKLLWLSSPAFRRNAKKHEALHIGAMQIGADMARKYPLDAGDIAGEILRLGVAAIEHYGQDNDERAYYMPDERKIYLNEAFITLMSDHFPREYITNALIAHELFHHIEEALEQPTDYALSQTYRTFVSPVYRDIAAFAFANAAIPGMVCQAIDIRWLEMRHPERVPPWAKRFLAALAKSVIMGQAQAWNDI